jgi:hypothetical protein
MALADIEWGSARSLKPLHKIRDLDLMFHAHFRDGNLHSTELFLDAFHPLVFALCTPSGSP